MFACDSINSSISLHSKQRPLWRLSTVSCSPVCSSRGQPESCGLSISPGTHSRPTVSVLGTEVPVPARQS